LTITEIPYGTTTTSIIDSIIKANTKNKIKIKRVTDNTAAELEILIELPSGASPEVTMDALYAFSDCEVSISPNACTIFEDKPIFCTVEDLLKICTDRTKFLLQ
jgi:topoisomerase-4 subunit A